MKHKGTPLTSTLNNEWMFKKLWVEDLVSGDEPDAKTIKRYVLRSECYVKSDRQHIAPHNLKDSDFRNISTRLYIQKEKNSKLHGHFVSNYEWNDLVTRSNLHNFTVEL
jgi:hypothetical protein